MARIFNTLIAVFLIVTLSACHKSIDASLLTGKWRYVKVENPYSPNPPDTVSSAEIAEQKPYIQFYPNKQLVMMWGGKVLSHGTFTLQGDNIEYTEQMPDGRSREFPFYVSKLTDRELIFETKNDDVVRVRAIKE